MMDSPRGRVRAYRSRTGGVVYALEVPTRTYYEDRLALAEGDEKRRLERVLEVVDAVGEVSVDEMAARLAKGRTR